MVQATLLSRYKRFLVDVRLQDGTVITAHCPNTGSMLGVAVPGAPCLILDSMNEKRALRFTLEAVHINGEWVGAHPIRANALGREAIEDGFFPELGDIAHIRQEVVYGQASRADLVLDGAHGGPVFVEIKSASLASDQTSMFPDSVTSRGLKHLNELERVVTSGGRALVLFVATRGDVMVFRPAWHIDPAFSQRLREVENAGVMVRALASRVTSTEMVATGPMPVDLTPPAYSGQNPVIEAGTYEGRIRTRILSRKGKGS